jgi:hypothetical protein
MTDPRKLDAEAAALLEAPLSRRERLVQYAKLFLAGAVAIAAVGALVGLVASPSVPVAIGYTAVFVGVVMLLAGGASGGGYANLGMGVVDRMVDNAKRDRGERQPDDVTPVRRSTRYGVGVGDQPERRDPMERLRKGLRPEKNPAAFWTVIGGFAYVGLGALLALS